MRTLLFFDLPTLTSKNRRDYRKFIKDIIKLGFYRIQESVFVKMHINQVNVDLTMNAIEKLKPQEGSIFSLSVTEAQFARMKILLGELSSDVISSDDRIVSL